MGCEYKSKKLEFPPGAGLINLFIYAIFIGHLSLLATMWLRIPIFAGILLFFPETCWFESGIPAFRRWGFHRATVAMRAGGHNLLRGPCWPQRGILVLISVPDIYIYRNSIYIYVCGCLLAQTGPCLVILVSPWGTKLVAQDVPTPIWLFYPHPGHVSRGFFSKFSDVIVIFPPAEGVVHPSSSEGKALGCSLCSRVISLCCKPTKINLNCNAKPAQLHFAFVLLHGASFCIK